MTTRSLLTHLLALVIGGTLGGFLAGLGYRSRDDEPSRGVLLAQIRALQSELESARGGAPKLAAAPPSVAPTSPRTIPAAMEPDVPPAAGPQLDPLARLEAARAEYLAAEASLRPQDRRVPFPQGTPSAQRWGALPMVADLLREEDADAYSRWRTESDLAFIRKYIRVTATDRDIEQFRPILTAFYSEQTRKLYDARRAWEDPNATAEERAQRRRAFVTAYDAAIEKRNESLKRLGQGIGRLETSAQPFDAYPP